MSYHGDVEPTDAELRAARDLDGVSLTEGEPREVVFYDDSKASEDIRAALERGEGFIRMLHDDGTFTDYPVRSAPEGEGHFRIFT